MGRFPCDHKFDYYKADDHYYRLPRGSEEYDLFQCFDGQDGSIPVWDWRDFPVDDIGINFEPVKIPPQVNEHEFVLELVEQNWENTPWLRDNWPSPKGQPPKRRLQR